MTELTEADILSKIGDIAQRKILNAKDRVMSSFGDKEAHGRLQLRAAIQELKKTWSTYVGREKAAGNSDVGFEPSVGNLVEWLKTSYGIDITEETLSLFKKYFRQPKGISDEDSKILQHNNLYKLVFTPEQIFPPLANMLIKYGYIRFNNDKNYEDKSEKDADKTPQSLGKRGFDSVLLRKYIKEILDVEQIKFLQKSNKTILKTYITGNDEEYKKNTINIIEKVITAYLDSFKGYEKNTINDKNFHMPTFKAKLEESKIKPSDIVALVKQRESVLKKIQERDEQVIIALANLTDALFSALDPTKHIKDENNTEQK